MKKKIFFIDPQSYNNLAMYDYEILSRIKDWNISFFRSCLYNYKFLSNIIDEKVFFYSKYKNPLWKTLSYLYSLIVILNKLIFSKPALVHIQWLRLPSLDYYYYYCLKRFLKVKLVYTVHNILPHKIRKGDERNFSRFYKLCDYLIVHTTTTKQQLISGYAVEEDKICVAPHGPLKYEFDQKKINKCVERLKDTYQLNKKLIFSMLGAQSYYKGTDVVLDAWRQDKRLHNNNNIVLLIGGESKDIVLPSELPKNVVCIPKRFSDLEFASLLRLTDVLLLPYRRIEQSGLLLTAITEHIPYCATACGELLEPLKKADIGWSIPSLTPHEIANLIVNIVENPESIRIKQSNEVGWNRINKMYDWSENVAETLKCYDTIIKTN